MSQLTRPATKAEGISEAGSRHGARPLLTFGSQHSSAPALRLPAAGPALTEGFKVLSVPAMSPRSAHAGAEGPQSRRDPRAGP